MNQIMSSNPSPLLVDILVLDNTAFVSGFNFNLLRIQNPEIIIVITPGIYSEAVKNIRAAPILEIAEAQNNLRIIDPSDPAEIQVHDAATKTGDIGALSVNDCGIIALALDMITQNPTKRVLLMSDDYSVQNTSTQLKIPLFKYRKQGIQKKIKWEVYCPQCFRVYAITQLGEECEMCGAELKRRAFKGKRGHL